MGEKQRIRSKPGPFTSIPLLYDDAKLSVYENRLLTHYARVGSSFEGVRTTATRCHMSLTSVIKARNGLADKGWITVGENEKGTIQVELVDVWALDAAIYGGPIKRPHEWVARREGVPNLERDLFQISNATVPFIERDRSNSGTKEDSSRKTQEEEVKPGRKASEIPAVELFRRINHGYPAKKFHDRIDREVGSKFFDLLTWGRTVKWWLGSGYNPRNFSGMLDVFGQRKADSKPAVIGRFKDD